MFTRFLLVVSAALVATTAIAQEFDEPMEKMGDPHQFLLFPSTSPRGVVQHGPFVSVQANVNASGNNIIGDAANEPSMCVDPTNRNRKAIGWRQFDTISSNFRQAGYGYTLNGGATWTFPGCIDPGVFRSDPVLCNTATGILYYNSLNANTFLADVYSSITGGATWGIVAGADGGDKQWMCCDTTNSSGSGFLYELWSTAGNNFGGRQFSRSTDGGQTWLDPINIPNSPVWGTLDVDNTGRLFLVGSNFNSSTFYVVRSSNAKNSAQTPVFDLTKLVNMGGALVSSAGPNPGGLLGQSWIACDRSNTPFAGNVYVLSSVRPSGATGVISKVVRSSDGGNTWSAPVTVQDDGSTSKYHWFGALSVAPNGRLDVVWLDTRSDPGNLLSALYYSYSVDAGATWAANVQISPAFNPTVGFPNQNKIGDYMQCVSDLSGLDVAYPATFNNEEDVYYVRITPSAISAAATSFNFITGSQTGGNASSLSTSDDNRLSGRAGAVLVSTQPPLQIELIGQSPFQYPSELKFTLEASASASNLQQRIFMKNYQTGVYDEVDSRLGTTTDSVIVSMPAGVAANYVGPSREVRALVTYKPTGPVLVYPWQAGIDQAIWSARP